MGRQVVLKEAHTGNYITGGSQTSANILDAKIWDYDTDNVEKGISDVKSLYGIDWLAEDAQFGNIPLSVARLVV